MEYVRDNVVVNQRKMVIFASMPAQQVLLFAILKAYNICTEVYHAALSPQEKAKLQRGFNEETTPLILIGSYATTSCGLNLQQRCYTGAFLDPPPSKAIGEQAGARIHRLGQRKDVELVTFSTASTFNDRQLCNNIRKAMPGLVANMATKVFGEGLNTAGDDPDTITNLGKWVLHRGAMLRYDSDSLPLNHNLPVLQGSEVLRNLLQLQMGVALNGSPHQATVSIPDDDDEFGAT